MRDNYHNLKQASVKDMHNGPILEHEESVLSKLREVIFVQSFEPRQIFHDF